MTPEDGSPTDDASSVSVPAGPGEPAEDATGQVEDAPGHDGGGVALPAQPRRARRAWRRRLAWGAISTVAVVVIAAVIAAFVSVPYYAITPGSGTNVSDLVAVPKQLAQEHLGGVLLTDVELVQLHALSYLYYELDSNAQVDPSSYLVGNATSSQYQRQGVVDMYNARQAATVVGLQQLGYKARARPDGVTVYQPERGAAGSDGLAIGDVIISVDAHTVRTIAGLVATLGDYKPGASVVLGLRGLLSGSHSSIKLRLGEVRVEGTGSHATEICAEVGTDTDLQPLEVHGVPTACLGISAEQAYATVDLPFKISISSDGIIGPSAGLAFTLGVIEKLDKDDLTAGLKIAATGTMSVTGQVGDVGGVAQKTIAVREAGASLFFVPPDEFKTAKANAGTSLKVLAVSTIGQAVQDLEALGGRLSPPSPSH
jgi:PDZ domain-containing protein